MDNPSSARPSAEKPSSSSGSQSSTTKPPVTQPEDEAGLMTDRSPLMTSYLHSRNSATSAEESAYLSKALWLRWTRFVLVVLTIATGTAAVGCAGHVLKRYNETNLGSEWHLTLWPSTVDVRPTLAILVAAVLATTLSVLYLVISLVPTPYSRTLLYNYVFVATSAIGLALCLIVIPFNLALANPSTHHSRDSIRSWTCKFSQGASQFMSDAHSLQIPVYLFSGMPIPAGFQRLCKESEVGIGLMIALLVLEFVNCTIAGAGILLEKKMVKAREERYASVEKAESGS